MRLWTTGKDSGVPVSSAAKTASSWLCLLSPFISVQISHLALFCPAIGWSSFIHQPIKQHIYRRTFHITRSSCNTVSCYVPFSFLIFLIWMFFLCLLISLYKGVSILLIYWKNQLFISLILCIVLFVSVLLISAINLIISCHLFLFGVFSSLCFRVFMCIIK